MITDTALVINIAIELFSSILCLVFLACILISDNARGEVNRAFMRVLLANIAVMLSDALAFFSIGRAGVFFRATNYIGNYCTYLFSYLLIMAFSDYLTRYLSAKAASPHFRPGHMALRAVFIVQGVAILLSVIALFNDMYFVIDAQNIYHRRPLYWLSQALGLAGMLINAGVILRFRRELNRKEAFALACYIVLPVVAIIIQTLVYGLVSVYVASTVTILIIYVNMQAHQAQLLREQELALSESRMAIMLSQIQPHFLYNSLASIGALCDSDPQEAKAMLYDFAHYLRGNLDSLGESRLIPFEKELEHVKTYLQIEQKRFQERLRVEFDICAREFSLPALTLQPIVENAVRYGVTRRREGGCVRIGAQETPTHWRILVSDDGVGFDLADVDKPRQDGRSHIGINNVRERLGALCGGALTITSTPGRGTDVEILIPKRQDKEAG